MKQNIQKPERCYPKHKVNLWELETRYKKVYDSKRSSHSVYRNSELDIWFVNRFFKLTGPITMHVTIVHNDTDAVKRHIHELRQGLEHVKPRVILKSCCIWEFQSSVFEENEIVLVLVSKQNPRFARIVYQALVERKYKQCRVCLVLEAQDSTIVEECKALVGTEQVADVENFKNSFTWMTKVCTFFFKNKGDSHRSNNSCVIPKVSDDVKYNKLRERTKLSLRELGVDIQEDFKGNIPKCCILFRRKDGVLEPGLKAQTNTVIKHGGTVIEYSLLHSSTLNNTDIHDDIDKQQNDGNMPYDRTPRNVNHVSYEADKPVVFILHVLLVLDLIKVTRIDKWKPPNTLSDDLSSTFSFKYYDERKQPNQLLRCCGLAILSVFVNPSMVIFFLTPFPYIALRLCLATGKARYWNLSVSIWMVTCTVMLAIASLTLGFLLGLGAMTLVFIPVFIPVGLSAWVQIRYSLLTGQQVRNVRAPLRPRRESGRQVLQSHHSKTFTGQPVREAAAPTHPRRVEIRSEPQSHSAKTITGQPVHNTAVPVRPRRVAVHPIPKSHNAKTYTGQSVRNTAALMRPRRVAVRPAPKSQTIKTLTGQPVRNTAAPAHPRRVAVRPVPKSRNAKTLTGQQVRNTAAPAHPRRVAVRPVPKSHNVKTLTGQPVRNTAAPAHPRRVAVRPVHQSHNAKTLTGQSACNTAALAHPRRVDVRPVP